MLSRRYQKRRPKEKKTVYAIIRDRGMQYRVEPGQVLTIDLINAEPGSQIELDEVLLVGDADQVKVGSPLVEGAVVRAEVLGEQKGEKIIVFRYRNKTRYRRRTGHRQRYTKIRISEIVA
jgi:large subunit ribosomal protein L21